MIGDHPRPGWVRAGIRRVVDQIFAPSVPPPTCAMGVVDRRFITVAILADDLAHEPELGFAGPSAVELLPVAGRLDFHRWLLETGRLGEGEAAS